MTDTSNIRPKQTIQAGFWVICSKLASKLVDLTSLLVLARCLGPADFGLVAMAMTTIFIVEAIFELPLSAALIRSIGITDEILQTAFTLGLLRGVIIGLLLAVLSWPIALVYGEPRLVELVCVLAFAPMMRGLISPRMVIFARAMNFRPEVIMEVSGKVAAAIAAIAIAMTTASYWALVAATVLGPAIMMVISYCMAPMRPGLTLKNWRIFSDLVGWNMLSQLISSMNWQLDRIILPRFVDAHSFGGYTISSDLVSIPFQAVLYPLTRPLLALLAKGQDYGEAYLKASGGVFLLMSPIFAFMLCMSAPLVGLVLGQKWDDVTPVFQALCLIAILRLPASTMWIFALLSNRLKSVTIRLLVELLAYVPMALAGIALWGIAGAIAAKIGATIIATAASMVLIRDFAGSRILDQLRVIYRAIIANILAGSFVYYFVYKYIADLNNIYQLLIAGIVFVAVYIGAVYALWALAGRPERFEALVFKMVAQLVARMGGRGWGRKLDGARSLSK